MTARAAAADPEDPYGEELDGGPRALPAYTRTASGRRWRLSPAREADALAVADAAGVDYLIARILAARGITAAEARGFLMPRLRDALPDPHILKGMESAARRIARAVLAGETIGVFGDYDVDGVSGAALLKRYFDMIGARCETRLPDRETEGYGPSLAGFEDLAERGARLIITVDCGANAHACVDPIAARGVDVVVLDHHQMTDEGPAGAVAIVNPNQPGDESGLRDLSAAGVVFMALVAAQRDLRAGGYFQSRPAPDLLRLLDLVALGLVCDVMAMRGLTRVLTAQGLAVLGARGNAGLAALAERCGVKGDPTAYHLGFLLGPRINAAGRIASADLALRLLTSDDPGEREALAERLHALNARRREIEANVLDEAIAQIEAQRAARGDRAQPVVVAAGEGWRSGVVGIAAGRLKERYDRPAFVIAIDGAGVGRGSGRSIDGVDLGAAVSEARAAGLLIAGGGHAMAAGLTIAQDRIEDFTRFISARLSAGVAAAQGERARMIDGVIAAGAATAATARALGKIGPFGPGNAEPTLVFASMRVATRRYVGEDHLALTLESADGARLRAIAFRTRGEPLDAMAEIGAFLHVAGHLRVDDWRGGEAAQLHLVDAAVPA